MNYSKIILGLAIIGAACACQSLEKIGRDTKEAGWETEEAMEAVSGVWGTSEQTPNGADSGTPNIDVGWPWAEVDVPMYEAVKAVKSVLEKSSQEYMDLFDAGKARFFVSAGNELDADIQITLTETAFEKACRIGVSHDESNRKVCRDWIQKVLNELGVSATKSGYN
ncbi:MAG: hypothetical protein HQ519_04365 [Planctomycetes bacterium]|nr:hypothetical protein [Planctomycetota bacterium]